MHHSSPSAITYPSSPQLYYRPLPYSTQPYSTQLYYPPSCPTTYPCRTPHSPTPTSLTYHLHLPYSQPYTHLTDLPPAPALLTALRPAHDLPHYSAIYPRSAYPTYVHTAPYPLLRSHPLHILLPSRTHVPLSTPPSPSPPQMYHATSISYRLYHTALPRTPLSSI